MSWRSFLAIALALQLGALAGCRAVAGVDDKYYYRPAAPSASAGGGSGGAQQGGGGEAGASPIVCEGGLVACGNSCVDLLNDPDHCARCDRSCMGGACT